MSAKGTQVAKRCKGCGTTWLDGQFLAAHLARNIECVESYTENGFVVRLCNEQILTGSAHMYRGTAVRQPWVVAAVDIEGKLVTIARFYTKKEALQLLQQAEVP